MDFFKKKYFFILALFLLIIVFSCFCILLPDHFSSTILVKNIEKEFFTQDYKELDKIVSRPLHYLGSGRQSIAFVSDDNCYVLKFFLNNRFYDRTRIRLPFRKTHAPKIRWDALESYDKAFQEIKEEAGLLGIHLSANTTHLPLCTLQDHQGKLHHLDLNQFAFLVQKRGACIKQIFSKMTAKEKDHTLSALKELLGKLATKGFYNRKKCFQDGNYAILGGEALMIDVGDLVFLEQQKAHPESELQRTLSFLNRWSKDN